MENDEVKESLKKENDHSLISHKLAFCFKAETLRYIAGFKKDAEEGEVHFYLFRINSTVREVVDGMEKETTMGKHDMLQSKTFDNNNTAKQTTDYDCGFDVKLITNVGHVERAADDIITLGEGK